MHTAPEADALSAELQGLGTGQATGYPRREPEWGPEKIRLVGLSKAPFVLKLGHVEGFSCGGN